jgi:SAM-dependent methyltransferase
MAGDPVPAWPALTEAQVGRWDEVLDNVTEVLPPETVAVVVDGADRYAAAVAEADLPPGGVAVDVGCGTGRALPALRAAVGAAGTVVGVDLTPQMLAQARPRADATTAVLILGAARRLPLGEASVDAVFAAGLVTHLPDIEAGLLELARVTRPDGRLVLFHPSGRAALAARHGRTLRPDEPLAEDRLRRSAHRTGWQLTTYDDAPHRFLAIGVRE